MKMISRKKMVCSRMAAYVVTMMALLSVTAVSAQEENDEVEAYLGADMVSRYMWRGQDRGGISIQPEAYVSWKGATLKAWGNYGFEASDPREINVTLGYELYGFNVGITDYWQSGIDPNDRYFHFDSRGAHQLEANIGYICKYFGVQAYTIFWGNDIKTSGEQAYSTFLELSVPFKLGGLDWRAAVGGTPFESAGYLTEGETIQTVLGTYVHYEKHYSYAEGPACTMVSLRATKNLNLGAVHLPLFAEFHANPYLQTANVLFGVTVHPF